MMTRVQPKLALRPFLPADAPLLAEIFRASVAELTGDDYTMTLIFDRLSWNPDVPTPAMEAPRG